MKRSLSIILILLIVAGGLRWTVYEPYQPNQLFQPIPSHASFISLHDEVGERWQEWTRNPVAQSLLNSAGLRAQSEFETKQAEHLQALMSSLAGKRTLLGFIPSLGITRQPGWVFASHLGGRAVWFRWLLKLYPQQSLLHLGQVRGVDVWMVDENSAQSERLYFSLSRGMLVGCYAADPTAQHRLLDLLDFGNPCWEELAGDMNDGQVCGSGAAPDRGWLTVPILNQAHELRFAFEEVEAQKLRGRICSPVQLPAQSAVENTWVDDALRQFTFPDSLVWGVTTADSIPILLNRYAKMNQEQLEFSPSRPVFFGIQGGEFSGRFLGMKVPSLLVALPVSSETEGERLLNALLDEINREEKAGLVPRVSVENGYALTLVDASVNSPYQVLSDKHKAACFYRKGWMIISSHARALSHMLDWLDTGSPQKPSMFPTADPDAQGHLWFNMDTLQSTAKPLLQMYKFKLLLDSGAGSKKIREQLGKAEDWLESFQTFDRGRISLYSAPGETMMDFHLEGFSP